MNEKICVIIPVYNSERYLSRCLGSLQAQTCGDFRILIVNDGSTDKSADIISEYARVDKRIDVITQENKGQAQARNAGIDKALSDGFKYLCFVDSDDWTEPHFLEALIGGMAEGAKISSVFYEDTDGTDELPVISKWKTAVVPAEDYYCHAPLLPFVAWGKLYDRSCFEAHRFPDVRKHEDTLLIYRLLFEAQRIAVVPAKMYYYFNNSSGTSAARWTPDRLNEIRAMDEQLDYFEKNGYKEAFKKCAGIEARMIAMQLAELEGTHFLKEKAQLEEKLRLNIERTKQCPK